MNNTTQNFDEKFWTDRYVEEQTGWNIGYPSTPLKEYIDQLKDKAMRILIPGAGNAYEAEYLHEQGFQNVFVLDIARPSLDNLARRCPGFPEDHLIHDDFFQHEGHYDLILEQTFFCALDPKLRQAYADKMYALLNPGGKLAGLWFCFPQEAGQDMPPFSGSLEEYRSYFRSFEIKRFSEAYNSIPPRAGRELFGILVKPA